MPWSYCHAACSVISQAASSSIQFFASGCWIAWFLPIGRLNTTRLLRVGGGARQRAAAEADRLGGDQDALGIHAVQDVFEAPALLADAILDRNLEIRRRTARWSRPPCGPSSRSRAPRCAAVEIGVEQAQAMGRGCFTSSSGVVRASSRILSATCAVEIQTFWPLTTYRSPLRTARVLSCVVLRPVFGSVTAKQDRSLPSTMRRQHAPALLLGAEHHDRIEAEHVHVDRRRAGHAGAGLRDGPHHDRGFGDAEAGAAILLGNADAEPAGIGQRLVEIGGKAAFLVLLQPIGVVEARADLRDVRRGSIPGWR